MVPESFKPSKKAQRNSLEPAIQEPECAFAPELVLALDPRLERGREQGDRTAAGDAHAGDASGIDLLARLQVVDGPHHVPRAPADHRLAEQERSAGGGLARGGAGAGPPGAVVPAVAET